MKLHDSGAFKMVDHDTKQPMTFFIQLDLENLDVPKAIESVIGDPALSHQTRQVSVLLSQIEVAIRAQIRLKVWRTEGGGQQQQS